jgi:hypothetical protein
VTDLSDLEILQYKKCASTVEYLHMHIAFNDVSGLSSCWQRYEEIFNQCKNLKAMELSIGETKQTLPHILSTLSVEEQEIWEPRVAYFKKRGIRFAKVGEIDRNENLRNQVRKEAGIPWIFHIAF